VSIRRGSSFYLWWRWLGIGLGAAVLIWLSLEENKILPAILLATGLCSWAAVNLLRESGTSSRQLIFRSAAVGLLAGLLVSPVAISLIIIKGGLHTHPQPDFSPDQIQAVFSRMIYFTVSGFLLGMASALFRIASREP
jgi:hypothetical protein